MRFLKTSCLLFISVVLLSCQKQKVKTDSSLPPPPPPQMILLKDIVIPNLPSPYYHFEYDTSGQVTFVSFASDFVRYHVLYDNGKIVEMRNDILVNKDRLQYSYDGEGRVEKVTYADSTGVVYTKINFTYDGRKLIKIERERKLDANFINDKTMSMTYYTDGNLFELTYHYFQFNGQQEHIYTDRFEQYDNKINVEGFSLIHNEFSDHLVLLPGVHLQKNNPQKETLTGDAENYTVDYTYTYDNNGRPLGKQGELLYLDGQYAGQRFQTNSIFSYY